MLISVNHLFKGPAFVVMTCFVIMSGCQSVDVFGASGSVGSTSREDAKQNERSGNDWYIKRINS